MSQRVLRVQHQSGTWLVNETAIGKPGGGFFISALSCSCPRRTTIHLHYIGQRTAVAQPYISIRPLLKSWATVFAITLVDHYSNMTYYK